MAFLEQTLIDQIEVIRNGTIQVREATLVLRDGIEIAKTYHRYCLYPGQDLAGQPAQVAAIATAAWTPEVVATYQASQES